MGGRLATQSSPPALNPLLQENNNVFCFIFFFALDNLEKEDKEQREQYLF